MPARDGDVEKSGADLRRFDAPKESMEIKESTDEEKKKAEAIKDRKSIFDEE